MITKIDNMIRWDHLTIIFYIGHLDLIVKSKLGLYKNCKL